MNEHGRGSAPPARVMVTCSWEWGPFGTYDRCTAEKPWIEGPNGYGINTVPVPVGVWGRYERALDELHEAEDALEAAKQAFLKEARSHDPRWQDFARRRGASKEGDA